MYLRYRASLLLPSMVVFALVGLAAPAQSQTSANILLVVNDSSQASVRIGEYYAAKRHIPLDNIIRLKVEPKDEMTGSDFGRLVQAPIVDWFGRRGAHDRILYIVLTKGVPLRVTGTVGRRGTAASVDSELALLYRRMTGATVPIDGPVDNPYFRADGTVTGAERFTHRRQDIFLVTRLDGFTVEDVLALIDRGLAPASTGRFVFDQKAPSDERGNDWLSSAAKWLAANGFADRVRLESTSRVVADEQDVIGYSSWGSNDPGLTGRHPGLTFTPGAIATMFVSTDARTFTGPPPDWRPGSRNDPKSYYAGSPQSLAGDLIHDGVTGLAAQISEPYLDGIVRPDILFPAYASGFNLAESFYLAMPYVSWQTVVIGDPLCAPFAAKRPALLEVDDGVDAATGLPALFARRRVREALDRVPNEAAATLIVKAEACAARRDPAGARVALERATELEPRAMSAHLLLATLYEQAGEYDKAIDRYRRTLAINPANVESLNNLAYALATRKDQPGEALPLAERAYTLAPGSAAVADTLGWIAHLLGDDARALPLLMAAVKGMPDNGEMQLHLAEVLAARGMLEQSRAALARAIALAPQIDKYPEVARLRARLKEER